MKTATEQEWQAARKEMLAAERALEANAERVEDQRRELPWVPVEKDYGFATEDGAQSLPELFEGHPQLLIYHLMFGEDWEVACPGCSSLADGLSGTVAHLNDRDVTLVCMSQAPLEKLAAYKGAARVDGAVGVRSRQRLPVRLRLRVPPRGDVRHRLRGVRHGAAAPRGAAVAAWLPRGGRGAGPGPRYEPLGTRPSIAAASGTSPAIAVNCWPIVDG